ncbi:MAG TPA: hypothetical protein GX497_00585 [Bacillus bacterium]|nr:hypothetical protein [Bacillus sp. (in: firmicutes)]
MKKCLQSFKKGKKGNFLIATLLLAMLLVFSGCSAEKSSTVSENGPTASPAPISTDADKTESVFSDGKVEAASNVVTYETHVKDLIASNCLTCHGSDSPTMDEFNNDSDKYSAMMKGPRFDSYENLLVAVNGSEAGALMRRLDDGANRENGEPGNMYQNLGKTDEERQQNLEMLKQWVGHWTLKRADELTDEDREKFKVLENN